jgi:hypothetical protein
VVNKSFHNTADTARGYQIYTGNNWKTYPLYVTLRNRSLTYQFFPHFHPYVPALIDRLNDSGFLGLQDSDTLYLPQPNPPAGQPLQPLTPIPSSTRATLLTNVTGHRPNGGAAVALSAGTPVAVSLHTSLSSKTAYAGQTLFDAHPYLTRLATFISPEEMTKDPLFVTNRLLSNVSNQHTAVGRIR